MEPSPGLFPQTFRRLNRRSNGDCTQYLPVSVILDDALDAQSEGVLARHLIGQLDGEALLVLRPLELAAETQQGNIRDFPAIELRRVGGEAFDHDARLGGQREHIGIEGVALGGEADVRARVMRGGDAGPATGGGAVVDGPSP